VIGSSKQQWMSPEMLTMFLYHHMRPLSRKEEFSVISSLVPSVPDLGKLFDFVHKLRDSTDHTVSVCVVCLCCVFVCAVFVGVGVCVCVYSQTCLSDHLYIATTCTSDHLFSTPLRFPI
jgi:hypothetical protein